MSLATSPDRNSVFPALQQAMLGFIDGDGRVGADGQALFAYPHPIFLAPFSP